MFGDAAIPQDGALRLLNPLAASPSRLFIVANGTVAIRLVTSGLMSYGDPDVIVIRSDNRGTAFISPQPRRRSGSHRTHLST